MGNGFVRFVGNCPANVNQDAKYSVRYQNGAHVVGLVYHAPNDERWYPTSSSHPELVKMVNQIKSYYNGTPGGSFYINEYKQVLVPAGDQVEYYYAGEYSAPLTFEFEGHIISGEAVDENGSPLQPGARWTGPHPGIPYVLKPGGKDIYYRYMPHPAVKKEVRLSKVIGADRARRVALEFARYKGDNGGRFYVNEFGSVFAPSGLEYIFLGKLDYDHWFPKPEIV